MAGESSHGNTPALFKDVDEESSPGSEGSDDDSGTPPDLSCRLQDRTARNEGDVWRSVEVSCRRRHHCADFEEFGRYRKNGTRSAQRPAAERVMVLENLVGEKEAA
ncbi:hypothetical protein HPB50_013299 [Hyalomma asiaticum]|uniref:Uncharacterized protein n=1 Tax=Hyalomma asiaticum TaxID=266040 RepID=A0ACB7RKL6_HYAAI|nr:hypothetical protein HPB50_013299 [Hyalomma asiaticum]